MRIINDGKGTGGKNTRARDAQVRGRLGTEGVSYAGYDVIENQSGKHIGKTRISKKGNSHISRILHMPSLSVITYEQKPFADLFARVYESTAIKMKGYVAVQKKLLVMIYTLWKKDQVYDANYKSTPANEPDQINKEENKSISGNEEHRALFPFHEMPSASKQNSQLLDNPKTVVPQLSGTTQDEHRYNESHEALFP